METTYKTPFPKDVKIYIDKIKKCPNVVNTERLLLVEYLEYVFQNEELVYSEEQILKYFSYEKYFPHALFEWEKFLFVLHYCVFRKDGLPRWSDLFLYVGRGAGKNYYLSWEDWCAITPTHGIMEYDIDICATSEEQAMTTFKDIYNILENETDPIRKRIFKKNFYWNQEKIVNKKTNSTIKYRTNNAKSKDGLRSGAVNFDEYHAYETYDNIQVFKTGLGKKENPRTTITTTDGDVRDGPLDKKKKTALDILNRRIPDNGLLVFMCKLDDESEVENIEMWQKANPSLEYRPSLLEELKKEYVDYLEDPISNSSFMTKRMNIPKEKDDTHITSWENILATGEEIGEDGKIKLASEGNGGIFYSMRKKRILDEMKEKNIEWVFIGAVDNLLVKYVDTLLLGLAIEQKTNIATRTVIKANPHEKVGVICKQKNRIKVVEYTEISEEMLKAVDENGEMLFGESHIMCNLFNIKAIEIASTNKLKYHVAHKKINYIENDTLVVPKKENCYKFEKFIFDSFGLFDNITILRGKREEDFAPIKNADGPDSPETAVKLYEEYISKQV